MRRVGIAEFLTISVGKALAFSLCSSVVLLLLYALGNYQGFLDSSQYLLLDMVGVSLWGACLSSACVMVLLVVTGIQRRRFAWVRFLAALVALAVSGLLVSFLEFLTVWIRG